MVTTITRSIFVIDQRHVIRVIYEELPEMMRIITFYPARKERYEN